MPLLPVEKQSPQITVLTLNRDAYEVTDPKLEEQIPVDVRVIRTRFIEIKRHLAIRGHYPSFFAIPDRSAVTSREPKPSTAS